MGSKSAVSAVALAALAAVVSLAAACLLALPACYAQAAEPESVTMHRLYNPFSGEHFYTADANEKDRLVEAGWRYEGVGWNAPAQGDDVFRLYNPFAGDHHYTVDAAERDNLTGVGWRYEGVGWKSGGEVPLYREYNPNAIAGAHNYTANQAEDAYLIRVGWMAEGIGWYGVSAPEPPARVADGYAAHGALHVEGARLVDEQGAFVQLKGVSTHGLAWFPQYVNASLFAELSRDWGANAVRLALYTAEGGGYCTGGDKAALRKLVDDGVRYATDNGLYVIIDWHILSDSNPNDHVDEAEEFFGDVSRAYANQGNVLYEICNEPNGATTWGDVKEYAQRVIPVIRGNDSDAIVIVGTPTWSQDIDQAAADALPYGNVMYALHFYAATHRESLRSRMAAVVESGAPVFVSEFGICDASGNGAVDEQEADAWVREMDRLGVSYIMWNLANKDESSSMFKATCGKVSGFVDGDLSESGAWLKRILGGALPEPERAGGQGNLPTGEGGQGGSKSAEAPGQTMASGQFSCVATMRSSWQSDGRTFRLYDLAVKNEGPGVSGWQVELPFTEDVQLSDYWNCTCVSDGRVLRIGNAGYNGSLAQGASATDVGVIVSASADFAIAG